MCDKALVVIVPIIMMAVFLFGYINMIRHKKVSKENQTLSKRYEQEEDFRRAVKKGLQEKAHLWGRGPKEENIPLKKARLSREEERKIVAQVSRGDGC